ncbi:hypothetical protein OAG76_00260 [Rubripirellula sp.]|nr:hypothetical protein [Rubripirellula sp.]MDB4633812.1 hypothetical protein [Rubripirellula sp.]
MLLCTRVITGERLAAFINPIFEDAFQDFNASDLLGGSLPNRKSKIKTSRFTDAVCRRIKNLTTLALDVPGVPAPSTNGKTLGLGHPYTSDRL